MIADKIDKADQKQILVVDDAPASLQLLTGILTDRGYRVRPASGGILALRSVAAKLPDLILLDVKMPDMDGFEVCRRLKSDESTRSIPVLFISAVGETSDKVKGFEAGGVDYLTKPFQAEEVVARVGMHLRLRDLANGLQEAKASLEKRVEERTAELAAANRVLQAEIVERKRAEDDLKRYYQLNKTIIDSMNDAVSLIDVRDFRIVGVNRAFLEEYGYSDESEIVGKHCYEITHHRSTPCTPPDDICPLVEAVRTGEHLAVDHVHYGRQGEKIYAEVSASPIKDENGNVVQVVHVSRDITDRKRAEEERERLLSDIARSNKELEQFAYVASHDLQEPLRMVSSYVQLLEKKYKGRLDEKADKYMQFAVDGAQRMQKLIEALLDYSRIATRGAEFRSVNTNDIFSQAVSNLEASITESHALITKDDLPTISGDETQLIQLFQNLIGNAIKYRKPETAPSVNISAGKDRQGWTFSVSDNGIGIEPRHFDQIFQIFQRLHARGEYPGTGIGLAICKRIVERHHGRIWVKSSPGEGATFFFTIPSSELEMAA